MIISSLSVARPDKQFAALITPGECTKTGMKAMVKCGRKPIHPAVGRRAASGLSLGAAAGNLTDVLQCGS
jgi:hypothetical protein